MRSKLDKAYRQESNPDIRERIFLVRRIVEDKQQHIVNVAKKNYTGVEHGLTNGTRDIMMMDCKD
ncbi:MAG: hypothetical protein QN829_09880 [Nitrososphaeraceae archaeon]|nr:hypothetical protein [Nitrososphaeraceae archaeon]MDW0315974.1 hypothetical protein [Nitrososphaeraceae archaeon]